MTAIRFVSYVCQFCGRTFTWPDPCTSWPNTTCGPHQDGKAEEFYVKMTLMLPANSLGQSAP